MNKQMLGQTWDQFRQKYGVYLRLLEAIPEECYYSHPVPGMRTPAELMVHISASVVRDMAQGIAKGRITADESSEAKGCRGPREQTRSARLREAMLQPSQCGGLNNP